MRIDFDKCIGCEICLSYCPTQAIRVGSEENDTVYISEDICVECGLCRRLKICPVDAFIESEETANFPRVVRSLFSDPNTTHKSTLVPGRGTEESKTNDVTGRTKRGEIGICIELGRPGLGCTFNDISLMTMRLKELGVGFMENNALTAFMDSKTGRFPDTFIPQRVLSAIIEIVVKTEELERVFQVIMEVGREIDTVFSIGIISRFDENGELPVLQHLAQLGVSYAPNAKINLGLGTPLVDD